jgi:hypothetical protein
LHTAQCFRAAARGNHLQAKQCSTAPRPDVLKRRNCHPYARNQNMASQTIGGVAFDLKKAS